MPVVIAIWFILGFMMMVQYGDTLSEVDGWLNRVIGFALLVLVAPFNIVNNFFMGLLDSIMPEDWDE